MVGAVTIGSNARNCSTSALRPPAFDEAFERLEAIVSPADARDFHSTTFRDVWAAAEDIERQLAARKSLRNVQRIRPLLDGLNLISGPIEVLCNDTPFLPWVWAPIKLMLQLAVQYTDILEKLLDGYEQIGNVMPRIDRFSEVFIDNPGVRHILSIIYADILEFHRRAYKFFRRKGWRNIFNSAWSSFGIRIKMIVHSLDRHTDWLDREASSLDIVEAKQWRAKLQEDALRQELQRSELQLRDALTWLTKEDQDDVLENLSRRCQAGTCDWLFENDKIVSWIGEEPSTIASKIDTAGARTFWLRGIPGSGKSMLCSQLIERLREDERCATAYYICQSYASQSSCSQILGSIAAQLLRSHKDLASYVVQEYTSQGLNPTMSRLSKILAILQQRKKTRIVVDGLDEIQSKEHSLIISELHRLSRANDSTCKVLFSSRDLSTISGLLQHSVILSLTDQKEELSRAIGLFVHHQIKIYRNRFPDHVLDATAHKLAEKAKGMFLWVTLIFATFEDVHSVRELQNAVDSLPKGLEGAYGRIIERIEKDMSDINRKKTLRILCWVAFSYRPLKMNELLDGISLHEENTVLNHSSRLGVSVIELCKPLIEYTYGKTVEFVHFSAKEFLIDKVSGPFLRAAAAHRMIILSCLLTTNDCFELFYPSISDDQMRRRVLNGYHGLFHYAQDYMIEHLIRYVSDANNDEIHGTVLIDQVTRLNKSKRELTQAKRGDLTKCTVTRGEAALLKILKSKPEIRDLIAMFIAYRKLVNKNAETHDNMPAKREFESNHAPTWHPIILHRYQDTVEELLLSSPASIGSMVDMETFERFKESHGFQPFLCRFQECPKAVEGLASVSERDKHEKIHCRRWKCADAQCPLNSQGCRSAQALREHNQKYHAAQCFFSKPTSHSDTSRSDGGDLIDIIGARKNSSSSETEFPCGGKMKDGYAWGCGQVFQSADALKEHYSTPEGSECISELHTRVDDTARPSKKLKRAKKLIQTPRVSTGGMAPRRQVT